MNADMRSSPAAPDNRAAPDAGFRLEQTGPLAELVLCRPARHNAFDKALIQGLLGALRELADRTEHSPRALLLRAEGKHFCAGADLDWMRDLSHADVEHNREDARQLALLMQTLDELPFPTLALVQGAAYGGALGLICACDIALASDDARFCLSEVGLGLVPAVISPYVVRTLGQRQARRYMLSAEPFDAITACRLNVIHQRFSPDALLEEGRALARTLCQNGPAAMADTKALLDKLAHLPASQHQALTVDTIARVRVGAEAQEGMQAFFDKRPPAWRPECKEKP
jgi:methylglutaconyl-CoA hydratase